MFAWVYRTQTLDRSFQDRRRRHNRPAGVRGLYTYNWEGSGALDRHAIDRRLAYAKKHNITHKTIPCFGFVLSTNPKNRSAAGMTIGRITSLVTFFKQRYPEMLGMAFSSEGLQWNDTGSLALVEQANALAARLCPDTDFNVGRP